MSIRPSQDGGTLQAIWRYPVKSFNGEDLTEAPVAAGGILGDRGYALIDRGNGKVASAKFPRKWAKLVELSAAFTEPPRLGAPLPAVRITDPAGVDLTDGREDPSARLSEVIGRPVVLTTRRPDDVSLERLDPLACEETILDIGGLMMEGRFADYAAVHILTTATLARLSDLCPEAEFDARRFRPNIVVETGTCGGFLENDWVGRTLAIGDEVRLRVSDPTPRCAIPTLGQVGLPKDPRILRTIVEHNKRPVPLLDGELLPCVGVYAFVARIGTLHRGDSVRVE